MEIKPPRFDRAHPDYRIECMFQIEDAFLAVVEAAEKAGWEPVTVARAMKSLATNYMLAREANAETDVAVRLAGRREAKK